MIALTSFERAILDKFLTGDHADLRTLREQMETLEVTTREMTGVGFYTSFRIPEAIPRVTDNRSFQVGDVAAEILGLKNGAGFILYVKNGTLDFLEGYTYDEPWPDNISDFALSYDHVPRDLRWLEK